MQVSDCKDTYPCNFEHDNEYSMMSGGHGYICKHTHADYSYMIKHLKELLTVSSGEHLSEKIKKVQDRAETCLKYLEEFRLKYKQENPTLYHKYP